MARVNDNDDVENIMDYGIYISPDDITKIEEFDDTSLFNNCIENGRFYIKNLVNPDEPDILIQTSGEKEIYVSDFIMDIMKSNNGVAPFKLLDDDVKLFEVVVINKELTKPLYDLMELLNKTKNDGTEMTIDNMMQKFLDLLIESGIDVHVSAAEMIFNPLIHSVNDVYSRPDFSKEPLEPYEIWTVTRSLERNKSATVELAFQNIKRRILSDEFYEDIDGTSYFDPYFKPTIDTSRLQQYKELAKEMKEKNLL